jgi:hypothetical protein
MYYWLGRPLQAGSDNLNLKRVTSRRVLWWLATQLCSIICHVESSPFSSEKNLKLERKKVGKARSPIAIRLLIALRHRGKQTPPSQISRHFTFRTVQSLKAMIDRRIDRRQLKRKGASEHCGGTWRQRPRAPSLAPMANQKPMMHVYTHMRNADLGLETDNGMDLVSPCHVVSQ